jgi:WXG100 family type VII secretion target
MSVLRVTPTQLSELGAVTTRSSAQLRAEHDMLRGRLTPLFGTEWVGAAATGFSTLFNDFDGHARGLCDALDGIGALLGHAGATYADVEQRIAATFR